MQNNVNKGFKKTKQEPNIHHLYVSCRGKIYTYTESNNSINIQRNLIPQEDSCKSKHDCDIQRHYALKEIFFKVV